MSASPRRLRSAPPLRSLRVTVLGPGAVGTALAGALARAGAHVTLWGRRRGAASAARRRLVAAKALGRFAPHLAATGDLRRAMRSADLVVLAVGDAGLTAAAEAAARARARAPGARGVTGAPGLGDGERELVAVHTNGFHGARVLAPLAEAGAACGVMHPLLPLPPQPPRKVKPFPRGDDPFAAGWFALGGDRRAVRLARRVAKGLGARTLTLVRESGREAGAQAAYHAAASLASGGAIALFDAALGPIARATDDAEHARIALLALMRRTLDNLAASGAGQALTGAAARGSAELVAAHVAALEDDSRRADEADADAGELYVVLARRMVALARRAGRLDARGARSVLARLPSRG